MKTSRGSATRVGRMGGGRLSPRRRARAAAMQQARPWRNDAPLESALPWPRGATAMNAPDRLSATARRAPDAASAEPHVMKTYGRLPIALSHGRGCWLWDTEGKKYLDGLGGIAVNTLGHAHPKLVPALQRPGRQADPQLELLPRAAAGAARREAVRALGPDQRLLLQLRPRGQRGGAQDRAQVRPRQGHRAPRDRRLRGGLPRPLDRDAVGDRQRQDPGRLRAAGRGLRARAAQRRRGDREGRAHATRTSSPSSSR